MAKRTREVSRVQVGKVFGNLTVIREDENSTSKHRKVICRCDCGHHNCQGEKTIRADHLASGATTTCGRGKGRQKWESSSAIYRRTYRSWEHMIDRCYNEKHPHYKHYGGRGIGVCDRWRHSFDAFLEDMGERPNGLTLDRIDNERGYEPGNCQWSTYQDQNRNKTNGTALTHEGETLSVTEWAEKLDISRYVIFSRLNLGWTTERALTTPVRFRRWAKRPDILTPEP